MMVVVAIRGDFWQVLEEICYCYDAMCYID